ncbi:MAG TPA: hypothetical protein VJQ57_13995 [Acidimicrobiia bacterium]|nr:hypothetical protein [Acidimicrobiia bacterium]
MTKPVRDNGIRYRLEIHGREKITLDNLAAAKRYAEEHFRIKRAGTDIEWAPNHNGGLVLTWRDPHAEWFCTSAYSIHETHKDAA